MSDLCHFAIGRSFGSRAIEKREGSALRREKSRDRALCAGEIRIGNARTPISPTLRSWETQSIVALAFGFQFYFAFVLADSRSAFQLLTLRRRLDRNDVTFFNPHRVDPTTIRSTVQHANPFQGKPTNAPPTAADHFQTIHIFTRDPKTGRI